MSPEPAPKTDELEQKPETASVDNNNNNEQLIERITPMQPKRNVSINSGGPEVNRPIR